MRKKDSLFQRAFPAASIISLVLLLVFSSPAFPQGNYRTFSQADLNAKKTKAGKISSSFVRLRFHQTTPRAVNSLHFKLNAAISSISDSGGFTTFTIVKKEVNATGRTVAAGDSVTLAFISGMKGPGTEAKVWYWDSSGVQEGSKNGPLTALSDSSIAIQPNGGNVLEYLYKHVITLPAGVLVGVVNADSGTHWVRYTKADSKFFPHAGPPSCFSFVSKKHELKNPKVSKFDDHLLGEMHALKLAIIANDNGVCRPDTPANRLGDLLYNDLANAGDPLNHKTIRAIETLADSEMTYCSHVHVATYAHYDSVVSRINTAFGGPYKAVTFTPFKLAGTQDLGTVAFLHHNPTAEPAIVHQPMASIIDPEPQRFTLYQNYPNPFNPTTTIQFDLPQQSLVTLKVYNIVGQEVTTLLNSQEMEQGQQQVDFDASNLASGFYLYRITAQGLANQDGTPTLRFTEVKKMMLIK